MRTGPAALPANKPAARGTTAVQSTGPATTKTTAEARVAAPSSMFLIAFASGTRLSTSTRSTARSMMPEPAPK